MEILLSFVSNFPFETNEFQYVRRFVNQATLFKVSNLKTSYGSMLSIGFKDTRVTLNFVIFRQSFLHCRLADTEDETGC